LGREFQTGKVPPVDGAGVNTDLIWSDKHSLQGCVSEDYYLAEVVGGEDELITDPDEVVGILLLQGYTPSQTCMNKNVSLSLVVQEQRVEEIEMFLRELKLPLLGVTPDGSAATIVEVEIVVFPIEVPIEKHCLMIPLEADHMGKFRAYLEDKINHPF
jgi:hypothetical protein